MVDTAFQTQYRQEFIAGFEQHQSLLRDTVTTEAVIKGNTATFLVADSGGAETTTRGVNGLIPARSDNLTQSSATLTEQHDLVRKTGFNVFASQGNQRQIMQKTTMAVVNRKIDSQITTILTTGTIAIGGTTTLPSVDLFQHARVKLSNASVPWDSNITLLCQPSFLAYLEQAPEFSSADYVSLRSFAGEDANWRDQPMAYRWKSALIVEHPNLVGKGTTGEESYLYHKSAVGHAADTGGMTSPVGYDEEQDYSYARCSLYMGAVLLQNAGVVTITADGSAYA
ncbi:MAG TPA: phage capsid protein [Dehalococcoidia bacterium]|nr:phage capsid protein [Dehalococcoidia bacterium]